MSIHYAVKIITDLACGVKMFKKKKCPTCGVVKHGPSLDATFNKRKVTCGNCRKTKVFRSRRKVKCEPLSEFEQGIKFDL